MPTLDEIQAQLRARITRIGEARMQSTRTGPGQNKDSLVEETETQLIAAALEHAGLAQVLEVRVPALRRLRRVVMHEEKVIGHQSPSAVSPG